MRCRLRCIPSAPDLRPGGPPNQTATLERRDHRRIFRLSTGGPGPRAPANSAGKNISASESARASESGRFQLEVVPAGEPQMSSHGLRAGPDSRLRARACGPGRPGQEQERRPGRCHRDGWSAEEPAWTKRQLSSGSRGCRALAGRAPSQAARDCPSRAAAEAWGAAPSRARPGSGDGP
jgi:hypothetical protein